MNISRYHYAAQFPHEFDALCADLRHMLLEGQYELGATVEDFEAGFAKFLEVEHVVALNSGTDALWLALRAANLQPGDEVILPANTFYATAAAVSLSGARPVLVDADESSYLMNLDEVGAVISSRTRVILPVHLYGRAVEMERVSELARAHDLLILEDAAQAHGARRSGQRVGTFGFAGAFSFHPSKNLAAAGDAGAVVTSSASVAETMRLLRRLGQRNQNEHLVLGQNSRMDALQARILSYKLPHLDAWNAARHQVAAWYSQGLAELPVICPALGKQDEHVLHLFPVRVPDRDRCLEYLRAHGVDAVLRYPTPIHLQPAFHHLGYARGAFPVAERLAAELLCLPIRPDLKQAEVAYVVDCLRQFLDTRRPAH